MQRLFFLLVFLCFQILRLAAQEHRLKNNSDSIDVISYREKLNISTGLQTNNLEFVVAYPKSKLRFEITPRRTLQQFLLFQYRWVNFRYSFTPAYLNQEKSQIKGDNKRSTFDMEMVLGDLDITLTYQKAKGYYIQNTSELISGWRPGDPYLQLNNLTTKIIGGSVVYNVNKKFSDVAMISGKSKQVKKAFSLIPALSVYQMSLTDPTIVPTVGASSDDKYLDINFRVPLAFAVVIRKDWSLAGAAGPVMGVNFINTNSYDTQLMKISNKDTRVSTGYFLQGGISYTRETWYTGFNGYLYQYGSGDDESRTRRRFYGLELYIGKRFSAPALLRKIL